MQLEDYTTGTASISNGSATLTGTGTAWDVAGFKAGDTFHAQGLVGIIASVDSDTAITLRDVWAGTSISGGTYLLRYQPDNSRMQGTTRQVLDQLRQGIWLTPDATGKTADKATYDARPAGFRFLDVSVDPFKLYVKESDTSGDWSSGADWVGPKGDAGPQGADGDITWEGAWATATAYTANQAVSEGGSSYVCIVDHTSGTFATDLAAGKWELMAQKGDKGDKGDTGTAGTNGTDGAPGVVQSITAGSGISVDSTDPANPKVTALVREILTANRTYYVATTGSDTNDGLTSGTAFLTLQGAYDAINSSIDTAGYTVTIQIGAGTYAAGAVITSPWVGGGAVIFVGDEATPANVVIQSVCQVAASLPARLSFRGFKTTASTGLMHQGYGVVGFRNIEFAGFAPLGQIQIFGMGTIVQEGDYSISNGATNFHIYLTGGGYFNATGAAKTVTLIGAPSFGAFITAGMTCVAQYRSTTFSGSMTGKRYAVSTNGVIDTGGGGASYFPGSIDGTIATGGQYT